MSTIDFSNLTDDSLALMNNKDLILMVKTLYEENNKLKMQSDKKIAELYEERLTNLEREVNKDKQYARRDSIEIVGIDESTPDEEIENNVIKILKSAQAKVGSKLPGALEIHAAHRKNKKGVVIVKFTNRKFAEAAIKNRDNIREIDHLKDVYINQSLCPEFSFLSYALRQAKRSNKIASTKFKHGVPYAKLNASDGFVEISHEADLVKFGIDVPTRRNK